jgi:DNA-binding transcriptional LysR family regulator
VRAVARSERWTYGLDWNLLRTFLVIAEERSITRAANRLLLQQPSVSTALKRLEETFGCRLFERGRRSLTLTPQGELLFAECRDLYLAIANLEPKLAAASGSTTGAVRLSVVTHLEHPGLDAVFRRINGRHPGISFEVVVMNSHEIVRSVSQKIAPFGLCLLTKPLATLSCQFLFRETFGLFCGLGHHLYGKTDATLNGLRAEPWVSFACAELAGSLEPMLSLRLGADLARRVVAVSADLQEVRRFIAAGVGIGTLPLPSGPNPAADPKLWQLPLLNSGELGADVYFLSNPAARHTPAELTFMDEMTRFAVDDCTDYGRPVTRGVLRTLGLPTSETENSRTDPCV